MKNGWYELSNKDGLSHSKIFAAHVAGAWVLFTHAEAALVADLTGLVATFPHSNYIYWSAKDNPDCSTIDKRPEGDFKFVKEVTVGQNGKALEAKPVIQADLKDGWYSFVKNSNKYYGGRFAGKWIAFAFTGSHSKVIENLSGEILFPNPGWQYWSESQSETTRQIDPRPVEDFIFEKHLTHNFEGKSAQDPVAEKNIPELAFEKLATGWYRVRGMYGNDNNYVAIIDGNPVNFAHTEDAEVALVCREQLFSTLDYKNYTQGYYYQLDGSTYAKKDFEATKVEGFEFVGRITHDQTGKQLSPTMLTDGWYKLPGLANAYGATVAGKWVSFWSLTDGAKVSNYLKPNIKLSNGRNYDSSLTEQDPELIAGRYFGTTTELLRAATESYAFIQEVTHDLDGKMITKAKSPLVMQNLPNGWYNLKNVSDNNFNYAAIINGVPICFVNLSSLKKEDYLVPELTSALIKSTSWYYQRSEAQDALAGMEEWTADRFELAAKVTFSSSLTQKTPPGAHQHKLKSGWYTLPGSLANCDGAFLNGKWICFVNSKKELIKPDLTGINLAGDGYFTSAHDYQVNKIYNSSEGGFTYLAPLHSGIDGELAIETNVAAAEELKAAETGRKKAESAQPATHGLPDGWYRMLYPDSNHIYGAMLGGKWVVWSTREPIDSLIDIDPENGSGYFLPKHAPVTFANMNSWKIHDYKFIKEIKYGFNGQPLEKHKLQVKTEKVKDVIQKDRVDSIKNLELIFKEEKHKVVLELVDAGNSKEPKTEPLIDQPELGSKKGQTDPFWIAAPAGMLLVGFLAARKAKNKKVAAKAQKEVVEARNGN